MRSVHTYGMKKRPQEAKKSLLNKVTMRWIVAAIFAIISQTGGLSECPDGIRPGLLTDRQKWNQ